MTNEMKKYYVFFDGDRNLIGQTTDKEFNKRFTEQLKKDNVPFEKVKATMTHKESREFTNFLAMELVSMEPYSERVYAERDFDSYTYYLTNLKNDLTEATNSIARLITMLELDDLEKRVILHYMEFLDYVNEDLAWFENFDDVDSEGDVVPEEYFDMDKIMKSMKDGTLTL